MKPLFLHFFMDLAHFLYTPKSEIHFSDILFPCTLIQAAHLVNPFPKTRFQQARVDRKEAVYHSSKTMPLGKSHDQSDGLPQGLDASATSFGMKTEKGVSVREMVSPHKTSQQVDKEFEEGRDLYKKVRRSEAVWCLMHAGHMTSDQSDGLNLMCMRVSARKKYVILGESIQCQVLRPKIYENQDLNREEYLLCLILYAVESQRLGNWRDR